MIDPIPYLVMTANFFWAVVIVILVFLGVKLLEEIVNDKDERIKRRKQRKMKKHISNLTNKKK